MRLRGPLPVFHGLCSLPPAHAPPLLPTAPDVALLPLPHPPTPVNPTPEAPQLTRCRCCCTSLEGSCPSSPPCGTPCPPSLAPTARVLARASASSASINSATKPPSLVPFHSWAVSVGADAPPRGTLDGAEAPFPRKRLPLTPLPATR